MIRFVTTNPELIPTFPTNEVLFKDIDYFKATIFLVELNQIQYPYASMAKEDHNGQ